jgi:hypothetical protein
MGQTALHGLPFFILFLSFFNPIWIKPMSFMAFKGAKI